MSKSWAKWHNQVCCVANPKPSLSVICSILSGPLSRGWSVAMTARVLSLEQEGRGPIVGRAGPKAGRSPSPWEPLGGKKTTTTLLLCLPLQFYMRSEYNSLLSQPLLFWVSVYCSQSEPLRIENPYQQLDFSPTLLMNFLTPFLARLKQGPWSSDLILSLRYLLFILGIDLFSFTKLSKSFLLFNSLCFAY